jgi:hypothetical protein
LDHAANSKSVSGLTRIIPDFQAHCIAISQIFGWMRYVASTRPLFPCGNLFTMILTALK